MVIRNESLLSHGQGSYRAIFIGNRPYGRGIRFSLGGYGWHWHKDHAYTDRMNGTKSLFGRFFTFTHYYLRATHISVGPFTFTIVHGSIIFTILGHTFYY